LQKCGRGNMGQQTCTAPMSIESAGLVLTAFKVPEISTFRRTGSCDSATDPDQEYKLSLKLGSKSGIE